MLPEKLYSLRVDTRDYSYRNGKCIADVNPSDTLKCSIKEGKKDNGDVVEYTYTLKRPNQGHQFEYVFCSTSNSYLSTIIDWENKKYEGDDDIGESEDGKDEEESEGGKDEEESGDDEDEEDSEDGKEEEESGDDEDEEDSEDGKEEEESRDDEDEEDSEDGKDEEDSGDDGDEEGNEDGEDEEDGQGDDEDASEDDVGGPENDDIQGNPDQCRDSWKESSIHDLEEGVFGSEDDGVDLSDVADVDDE
nr:unnamed protein product [Spirometra erinaceieuropaei]